MHNNADCDTPQHIFSNNMCLQVVASQDWPEVTKYAGLVCAQAHRQELIQDLYKTCHDPHRGTVTGGMIRFVFLFLEKGTLNYIYWRVVRYLPGSMMRMFIGWMATIC